MSSRLKFGSGPKKGRCSWNVSVILYAMHIFNYIPFFAFRSTFPKRGIWAEISPTTTGTGVDWRGGAVPGGCREAVSGEGGGGGRGEKKEARIARIVDFFCCFFKNKNCWKKLPSVLYDLQMVKRTIFFYYFFFAKNVLFFIAHNFASHLQITFHTTYYTTHILLAARRLSLIHNLDATQIYVLP